MRAPEAVEPILTALTSDSNGTAVAAAKALARLTERNQFGDQRAAQAGQQFQAGRTDVLRQAVTTAPAAMAFHLDQARARQPAPR
ncbi:MAG: hypothetical protein ACOCP9_05625 [Halofilum sp. (in: g-proteobacteria)]